MRAAVARIATIAMTLATTSAPNTPIAGNRGSLLTSHGDSINTAPNTTVDAKPGTAPSTAPAFVPAAEGARATAAFTARVGLPVMTAAPMLTARALPPLATIDAAQDAAACNSAAAATPSTAAYST